MVIHAIDVTLRDGGNRTNFYFKDDDLQTILPLLDHSGIEYIEIGYRNGAIRPVANIGRAGLCAKDYLHFCRALIQKAKVAVMVHSKNVTRTDLLELKSCGVNLLRICVLKGELQDAFAVIEESKQLGLEVSVNFIHASYYNEAELDNVITQVSCYHPDMIYFADSNGSLLPTKIKAIYEKYTQHVVIPFGFHAHDNLGLAQANTIAAIDAGVQYIDFSLAGMGKGIGNLRTEFFTAFLHALNVKKYHLDDILLAANYIRKTFGTEQDEIEMDEFVRGITDLSTADLNKLKKNSRP